MAASQALSVATAIPRVVTVNLLYEEVADIIVAVIVAVIVALPSKYGITNRTKSFQHCSYAR